MTPLETTTVGCPVRICLPIRATCPTHPHPFDVAYPKDTRLLLWLYSPLLGLGRFFIFLILYAVGGTPWTGDQPVARLLPTHRTTQTQNKRTHTSMP
jgi:hypothetical protein